MKISLIEKEYQNKIRLLKKYNEFYYVKSDPKISDYEYDSLKKKILELEKNINF